MPTLSLQMKLYAISGLGADKRVFKYLKLSCELVVINWIEPKEAETIQHYATRLAKQVDTKEKYGILGVSFGGLVAVEMSKQLNPALTVLVSSAETKYELRSAYRLLGKSQLITIIPKTLLNPPRIIANWLFGTKEKELLNQILNDTDWRFAKWAVNELLRWDNQEKVSNQLLKISGTSDKLIPPSDENNLKLVHNGEHLMIIDKAESISQLINNELITLDN